MKKKLNILKSLLIKLILFFKIFTLSFAAFAEISPAFLSEKTLERFKQVPEFDFIIQEARQLGVKVYLFGGTASAFAHYVRWDLEREAGDDKYQKERFDYDFTNIYRGNQDLDLVIDGTPAEADVLRRVLQEKYPHFMGARDAWEVRLLREPIGDKLPLLDDYDFKNQHTDTNSTGMLALNPAEGEIVYRDLLDWDNPESEFLKDVTNAKIKFIYSDKHETTSRFKDGKNPPILAAIRYLAKLTQYEVEGTPEDLEIVKKVIAQTKPEDFNSYVRKKAFEFGLKALLNAPDVEYAWNLLDETGARELLMEVDGNNVDYNESLSWWFNKEPLRSFKVGEGEGITAEESFESGEIIISHETKSFIAYENITRSAKGRANVFISRDGAVGEGAAYGDGFYALLGQRGAVGSGLTIRFKLDPKAKEGVDYIREGPIVIVRNKNAITLIQENLNISMIDYLKLLGMGEITEKDKGLIEKFNRKFGRVSVDSEEFKEAVEFVKESLVIKGDLPKFLRYDFSRFSSNSFKELVDLFTKGRRDYYRLLISRLLNQEETEELIQLVSDLIDIGMMDFEMIEYGLSKARWSTHPNLVEKLLTKNNVEIDKYLIEHVLSQPDWQEHPHLMKRVLERNNAEIDIYIARYIFAKEYHPEQVQWVKHLLSKQNKEIDKTIVKHVLPQLGWEDHPEIVSALIDKKNNDLNGSIAAHVLVRPDWIKHPLLLKKILDHSDEEIDSIILTNFNTSIFFDIHPALILPLVNRDDDLVDVLLGMTFDRPFWQEHRRLQEYIGSSEITAEKMRAHDMEAFFTEELKKYSALEEPQVLSCQQVL